MAGRKRIRRKERKEEKGEDEEHVKSSGSPSSNADSPVLSMAPRDGFSPW